LVGYFVEQTPSAVYGGTFGLPLYDRVDHIHVTFRDRWVLSETPVEKRSAPQSALAQRLLEKIEIADAALVVQGDPLQFSNALRSKDFRNPWVRRAYAFTQIILGNTEEALLHLSQLAAMTTIARYPHFLEDVGLILKLLHQDSGTAITQLRSWETSTREQLGVDT
jgi:hypothetical protein